MSAAEEAIATALQSAALGDYEALRDRVADVAKAVIALRAGTTMLEMIRAADTYSLAAEALTEMAERVHRQADAALLTALNEAGAPTMRIGGHTLGTRLNAAGVDITDPSAVPPDLMTDPKPPCPDRAKIRAYLKDHSVNWAHLREPTMSLTRRTV